MILIVTFWNIDYHATSSACEYYSICIYLVASDFILVDVHPFATTELELLPSIG